MSTCNWQLVDIADDTVVRCTACGTQFSTQDLQNVTTSKEEDMPNYCPHCGAKTTYVE